MPEVSLDATFAAGSPADSLDPQDMRAGVLTAYTKALSEVYVVGIAYGGVALLCAFLIKREKMVTRAPPKEGTEPTKEKAALVDADAMV